MLPGSARRDGNKQRTLQVFHWAEALKAGALYDAVSSAHGPHHQLGTAADSSFLPKYAAGWISTTATGFTLSFGDEDFLRLVSAPGKRLDERGAFFPLPSGGG